MVNVPVVESYEKVTWSPNADVLALLFIAVVTMLFWTAFVDVVDNEESIVGLLDKSLYEPDVATVDNPETKLAANLFDDVMASCLPDIVVA